jgi:1-acyl-sn-glycerol-3-phosphate acyltransferase
MQHSTIFQFQLLHRILRSGSTAVLKAAGWQIEAGMPAGLEKCVLIAAPHTSNWDFVFLLKIFALVPTKAYFFYYICL